jgi:hypothetical protein
LTDTLSTRRNLGWDFPEVQRAVIFGVPSSVIDMARRNLGRSISEVRTFPGLKMICPGET